MRRLAGYLIVLAFDTAVRPLGVPTAATWNPLGLRDPLWQHLAAQLPTSPEAGLGTVGIIDETSARKQGD